MSLESLSVNREQGLTINAFMRKLFVGPFYKQHASTFLFLYVLFLGSFLFINYLGEMPASESFFWHFVLLIFMVTHQFMIVLFICLAGFYLFKTRLFVRSLLKQPAYAVLKESLGVLSEFRQWGYWFKVQFWLSLPLLIYGIACLLMSAFYGKPIYGIVIILFLLIGILIMTSLNFLYLNRYPSDYKIKLPAFIRIWKGINRTGWTTLLYLVNRERPALILTKAATLILTFLMVRWQVEAGQPLRQWWLSFLVIASAHVLLVYKSSVFMSEYFKDMEGLALGKLRGFLFSIGRSYFLLLIPELVVLWIAGYGWLGIIGLFAEWILLIFYHYFAAYLEFNLKALLKTGFLLLCAAFVLTLYGLFGLVLGGYLCVAWLLFWRRYYCLV